MRKTDIIIPVYQGFKETRVCIESALQTLSQQCAGLIIINDGSPNPGITDYLRNCAQLHPTSVTLLENPHNSGFVASVNRGMALRPEHDALILNSDTKVSDDWLIRLKTAAYKERSIGSVTPFSNNAMLCSFPNIMNDNELFEGLSAAELDQACSQAVPSGTVIDLPTGVGFCMFIKRSCLDEVGLFSTSLFGKGYGEENEWCQRAALAGWRNVQALNVFVEHKGGVSFADQNNLQKDQALATLARHYPDYLTSVQHFISEDPARLYRMKSLLTAIARSPRAKILAIDHGLGGGVVQHIEELASFCRQGIFLRLFPLDAQRVQLMLSATSELRDTLIFDTHTQYDELVDLCKFLAIGHVHFHHLKGLPDILFNLCRDLACQYDVSIHDYYFINGNPTLTDSQATFCGDRAARDSLCREACPITIPVEAWQQHWRLFLSQADRVIFPSVDAHDRFNQDYPLDNTVTAWHPDYEQLLKAPVPTFNYRAKLNRPLKVLILGYLSKEKGADIADQVIEKTDSEWVEFHLLGYSYRPLSKKLHIHGPYHLDEVSHKVAGINADIVWFPAQWPETYSYTLSIALRHGLPVVVPDLGAFAERISGRPYSVAMPWCTTVDHWLKFWEQVAKTGHLLEGGSGPEKEKEKEKEKVKEKTVANACFYREQYLRPDWNRASSGDLELQTISHWVDHEKGKALSPREKLLRILWRIREHSVLGRLATLVPFRLQRFIKRKLSRKALHDIVR